MTSFRPHGGLARPSVHTTGACLIAILLLFTPGIVFARSAPLSLEAAVQLAVQRAPLLDARNARVEAARQELQRAGALPDPMLMVGISNLPVTGPNAFDPAADLMTMKKIGIRQEIPAGAKRDARRNFAARTLAERQAQAVAIRREIRRRSADAWVALWAAERKLDEITTLHEQTRLVSNLAHARVAGGSETAAQALAANMALLQLDNRVTAAEAEVVAAQVKLARWVAIKAPHASTDMPNFRTLPVPTARLLTTLDRLGPLLVAKAEVDTAGAAVDLARAEKRSDWSVSASYGQRSGGRSDMFMLEFGIELPLFTSNRQDRGIAARRAEFQAALAVRDDARRAQAARIRADIAQWQGLKQQVARDLDELLPLASDRSATALAAYRAGAPIRPWLDARRDQLDLVIEHSERLKALGRAWAALAYLLPGEVQP